MRTTSGEWNERQPTKKPTTCLALSAAVASAIDTPLTPLTAATTATPTLPPTPTVKRKMRVKLTMVDEGDGDGVVTAHRTMLFRTAAEPNETKTLLTVRKMLLAAQIYRIFYPNGGVIRNK